jgi:hypothetical protein
MDAAAIKQKSEACGAEAGQAGSIAALKTAAVLGPLVLAATKLSPAFRRNTGVGVRVVLVVMPVVGAFFVQSEFTMTACARRDRDLKAALQHAQ